MWYCLAVLVIVKVVIVKDDTGEKENSIITSSPSVMAELSENSACHEVKLSQIFYILYGYMVNRNLASLSSILYSKSIRDFLT